VQEHGVTFERLLELFARAVARIDVATGVAQQPHASNHQQRGGAPPATVLDRGCRDAVRSLQAGTVRKKWLYSGQGVRTPLDPAWRRADADSKAVVFTDEQKG
jgi:hypothetical protein